MIKSKLGNIIKYPVQLYRRKNAIKALIQLNKHHNPKIRAISEALYESLTYSITKEEQDIFNTIERRRAFLLSQNNEISIIDYGAGQPSSKRTKEEMKRGVKSKAVVADICKFSKPVFWATVLFKLIRKLEPTSCVELGSCVGISASYQSVALNLNGKGNIQTLEGSPEIAKIAKETLECLNIENAIVTTGPFHETFKGVLECMMPIDFFFNDGHHDHDAVMYYFKEALPYLSNEAVIIFDDISWSPSMRKAWTEIEKNEHVIASIDLKEIGIALIGNNLAGKVKYKIPL